MRIHLQPAFILHHRPYRETSVLLDAFTPEYGRVSLIARGVRTSKSPLRALLQPFSPLLLSWQGKTELMTLQLAESQGLPLQLKGACLLSGFYLNELLIRLLQKQDPHPQLYTIYQRTLLELERVKLEQKHLRLFEKRLLDELGYGLQLLHSVPDRQPFQKDRFYRFLPEEGFEWFKNIDADLPSRAMIFSGKSLLALQEGDLEGIDVLLEIKRLMRIALGLILGPQPLHSRKLFTGVIENE